MEPEPPVLEEHLTETSSAAAVGEASSGVEPEPSKLENIFLRPAVKWEKQLGLYARGHLTFICR